ncbi:MAG: hypothetical protein AAF982_12360 [Pseudomonadota bacterium]
MAKRYPLPKRFSAAMSEAAYDRLRALNADWHLSNNYLLTVLLENLDELAEPEALERVFRRFIARYGAPEDLKKPR